MFDKPTGINNVETLLNVLVDAMQSAYEKMPGAHEYAWVVITPETGEFRVIAQDLDPEDGEPVGEEFDVTPDGFGRIAAQAFKQVMTQKIREAERELKYEEYAGREGDIVTGIIQQSDSRYTLLGLGHERLEEVCVHRVVACFPDGDLPGLGPGPQAKVVRARSISS